MITSKERALLMSYSMDKDITEHIGKDGITKEVLRQIDLALEANELVKIKVLPNSMLKAKEVLDELCTSLKAEPVKAVGRVAILYRKSKKEKIKHLLEK